VPAIKAECIREVGTKRPIKIPQRFLNLEVPRGDPLQPTLAADNDELITHFFARPTPHPGNGRTKVQFKVNKQRTEAVADIGHRDFNAFLKCEPYFVQQESTKTKRIWTLQIGPFAEHIIELERKWGRSKIATLAIDGTPLVEVAPVDLDCDSDWECKFRFKGEKCVNFEKFESNQAGMSLDTMGLIERKMPYSIECEVKIPDSGDLTAAQFKVGGKMFEHLQPKPTKYEEENIKTTPEALMFTHNLRIPYKIDAEAKSGLEAVLQSTYENVSRRLGFPTLLNQHSVLERKCTDSHNHDLLLRDSNSPRGSTYSC
jgi:hypothetical protein